MRALAGLLTTAQVLVGNDNGTRHLAIACGVPTVGLFGPHDPAGWTHPAHTTTVPHRVLRGGPCVCDSPSRCTRPVAGTLDAVLAATAILGEAMSVWMRVLEALIVLLAVVSPWSISGAEIVLGLATLWCLAGWAARRLVLPASALWRPLAAFAAVCCAAAIVAERSLPRGLSAAAHEWIVVAACVAATADDARPSGRAAAVALLASESLLGVYCLYQHVTGTDPLLGRAVEQLEAGGYLATGTFSHHLTLAGHAMLAMTVALAVVAAARRGTTRAAALAACAGCGAALLWSYGRSAWIGALLAAPVALLAAAPTRRRDLGRLLFGLIAAMLLVPALRARLLHVMSDDVVGPRLRLWETALRVIQAHPVLGVGPGNWHAAFVQYHVPGFYWSDAHAHNDYLAVAANAGVIGLAAFLVMWGTVLASTLTAARARRGGTLAVAGAMASVAVLAGGVFQCFQTDAEVAILLWSLVGAGCAAAREEAA